MKPWRATYDEIVADCGRLRTYCMANEGSAFLPAWLHRGFIAMLLYRIARHCQVAGWSVPARLTWLLNLCITGADLSPFSIVGAGCVVPYPRAVTIYGVVGTNCSFMAQSGMGGAIRGKLGLPMMGDDVVVQPGSIILGSVQIGDGALIGPRCVVTKDVPAGAFVAPLSQKPFETDLQPTHQDDVRLGETTGWRVMRRHMSADRRRLRAYFEAGEPLALQPGHLAVMLHRLAHQLHQGGWCRTARLIRFINIELTGADIDPSAQIGPGLVMPNPQAVTLRGTIGNNCTIMAHSSVGVPAWSPTPREPGARNAPVLGDDVVLEPGAVVLGAIRIGDRARIGARRLVMADVPDGAEMPPLDWRAVRD